MSAPSSGHDPPARIADVAARAGVSPSLVSRVLNEDTRLQIRPQTRAAIDRAVCDLGYVPDYTARALRGARTQTFGLALEHVTDPMFTDIVRGAQQSARIAGVMLLLIDAADVESGASDVLRIIQSRRIDGLVIQAGYGRNDDRLVRYVRQIPSVVLNRKGTQFASGVRLQDERAARLATEHLLMLGHTELAFVGAPGGVESPATKRSRGFKTAVRNAGLSPQITMAAEGWQPDDTYRVVTDLTSQGTHPTGYVVANAGAAIGVVSGLRDAGLDVPGDVSVVAIHDTWVAPHLSPPLTTVRLPMHELGVAAIEILHKQLAGGRRREHLITDPEPELILRRSTQQR